MHDVSSSKQNNRCNVLVVVLEQFGDGGSSKYSNGYNVGDGGSGRCDRTVVNGGMWIDDINVVAELTAVRSW